MPSIFNVSYSNDVFTFRSTNSSRTIDSMKAFTKGLFGDDADSITPNVVPEKEDKLLKVKFITQLFYNGLKITIWCFIGL